MIDIKSIDFTSVGGGGVARLIYRGVDISGDLSPLTTSINYTDHWHGEADEIDVTVHDKDGRWKGSWLPEHGDKMQLFLSDDGFKFVDCGVFELDEPEANGGRGGDFMTMRGLAVPITKALRTQQTFAYENKKLEAVVKETISRAGLSLEGKIDPLFFKRITQRRETDLEFLTRLAQDTGHYFSIRGTRAIFTNYKSIDGRKPTIILHLEDKFRDEGPLINYTGLKFQSKETYSKASVQYSDPDTKKVVKAKKADTRVKTGDELKIRGERVENAANADALAKARLHMKNRKHKVGSFTMQGNMKALAGNTIGIEGFGKYDDTFVIDTGSQAMSRSGHITNIETSVAAK